MTDAEFVRELINRRRVEDPELLYQIGEMHYYGNGIEENREEAVKWYKLASDKGHDEASFDLGVCYWNGRGVGINKQEALEYYELSAAQGYVLGQYSAGVCYYEGTAGKQDYTVAIRYFEMAERQRFWKAFEKHGDMFFGGVGVDRNLEQAKQYYENALKNKGVALYTEGSENISRTEKKLADTIKAIAIAARNEVFLCYAHEDAATLDELLVHLKGLKLHKKITIWYDKEIRKGAKWDPAIEEHLNKAKVAVVLVSSQLLASDYICNKELPMIKGAAEGGELTALWLLVDTCDYSMTELDARQAAMKLDTPLESMGTRQQRNEIYVDVTKEIRNLFTAQ